MMERVDRMETQTKISEMLSAENLPVDDLNEDGVDLFCQCENERPLAAIGIERHGASGLLRSLVVAKTERGQGLADRLVNDLEDQGRKEGLEALYLLTETASGFFERLGYQYVDRDKAPSSIKSTRQFSSLYPASARLMMKTL